MSEYHTAGFSQSLNSPRQQPGILPVFICDLRDASKVIDYKKQIYI